MDQKTIDKYGREFLAKSQRAYERYQMTGESKYFREYEKNDDLADICNKARSAAEQLEEADVRRDINFKELIKTVPEKDTFTREEVISWLQKVRFM